MNAASTSANAGATTAGALHGILLLLICSVLYERFVAPWTTVRRGGYSAPWFAPRPEQRRDSRGDGDDDEEDEQDNDNNNNNDNDNDNDNDIGLGLGMGGVETWWWGVYVLGAPLVFGGGWGGAVAPVVGLFGTRFAFEVLAAARGHWLLALGARSRCPGWQAQHTDLSGLPVLVERDGDVEDECEVDRDGEPVCDAGERDRGDEPGR